MGVFYKYNLRNTPMIYLLKMNEIFFYNGIKEILF